jgi:uncharacterized membrane protein
MRHSGPWAIGLAILAVAEDAGDLHPKAPPRTAIVGLSARVVSGIFVGWFAATSGHGSVIAGAIAGAIGALIGAYGGLAVRLRAIAVLGNVPSGLLEDLVAAGLAVLVVSRLP